jgi:hypothetical protein
MPNQSDRPVNDAATLAKAVETVFRKLIRFLVGRISLVRLQEMIQYIYVEEAERSLKKEYPGKNVPMTKLALVTGLDTRKLIQLREKLLLEENNDRKRYLTELTPESAVVEAWSEQINQSKGGTKANELTYGDNNTQFEKLVRSTVATRGITTQSILQRLIATKSVIRDKKSRKLRLVVDQFSPYLSNDEFSQLTAAFASITSLLATIEHNIFNSDSQKYYQRQFWTFRLQPENQQQFRSLMHKLLEKNEQAARKEIEPWETAAYDSDLLTAGVGFYYFEESEI